MGPASFLEGFLVKGNLPVFEAACEVFARQVSFVEKLTRKIFNKSKGPFALCSTSDIRRKQKIVGRESV